MSGLIVKILVSVSAVILVLGVGLWLHDIRVRSQLLSVLPPQGNFIETDNATLHYLRRDWDKSDKKSKNQPVFVLIHGSSANAQDMMLALGESLSPHGTVLAFDRPGIGRSLNKIDNLEMSDPRKQAREIHQAVRALGFEQPVVIGQSWGGSVALAYAHSLGPEITGSIMLAPPIIPWYGPDFWAYRLATTPIIGTIFTHITLGKYGATQLDSGAAGAAHPEVTPDGYVRDSALALILQPNAFITNAVYALNLRHHLADMQTTYEDMPGTQGKLMILHGDSDPTVSINYNAMPFLAKRPDVELIELAGAGHLLHHTWKAEITAQVLRFLKDGKVTSGKHQLAKAQ